MVSESTSVDNNGIVTSVMNINNVSVMKWATVMVNNNCIVRLLVVNVNKGIMVSMMNINNCVMWLSVSNKNGIMMVGVDINDSGVMVIVLDDDSIVGSVQVFGNNDSLNNWFDDGLNNDVLLVDGLLFNDDVVIVATVDSFLVNFNVDVILRLDEDLTSQVTLMEDIEPFANTVVVG